jgi:hypothetical protein
MIIETKPNKNLFSREHPNFARRQENGEFIRDLHSRIKTDYADDALTATI